VNFELATNIRTAINNTLSYLRPPVMGSHLPEATRTALQAHLDALLKEELRALTGQAPEGVLAGKFMQQFAEYIDPRKDPEPPTPWYPDDSGEWVEVPDDCTVCPLPDGTFVHYLLRSEREGKDYAAYSNPADELNWDLEPEENGRIVAYKVVKP
jgi:hypothetical protein